MNLFYKYVDEHGIDILDSLRLKVTPPNQFNDPFEITPESNTPLTKEGLLARLASDHDYVRRIYGIARADGFRRPYDQFVAQLPGEVNRRFRQIYAALREAERESDLKCLDDASEHLGIVCLSIPRDNIVLRAHYGGQHKGLALGFDLERFHK